MTTQRRLTSILEVIVFASVVIVCVAQNVDAVGCGPGADWVDSCLSGTDTLNSLTDHGVVIFDAGPTVILPVMRGIVVIFRGDHTGPEPQHIDTEMVSLQLSGGGLNLRAGDGTGDLKNTTGSSLFFSPGRITENGTGLGSTTAASFFDVFFELSPTPFGPLHNALQPPVAGGPFPNACIMDFPTLTQVPPPVGTAYTGCAVPTIDLVDAAGMHRAILTGTVFHIILAAPEPSTLLLLGFGLVILAAFARMRLSKKI